MSAWSFDFKKMLKIIGVRVFMVIVPCSSPIPVTAHCLGYVLWFWKISNKRLQGNLQFQYAKAGRMQS